VGVSIVLAFTKRLGPETSKAALYRKIVIRSLKIFAVGVFLSLIPYFNFAELRVTGVLQRIAIVFLACSFIFLNTSFRIQVWTGAVILVAYWLMMTLIPTPGYDQAMLEPGINFAAWFDSLFLPGKMWQGTWDPEGFLSTLPAIASGMAGLLAGQLLLSNRPQQEKAILLMVAGFFSVLGGYLWDLTFPVNKNIWTSSYVLVTAGAASLALGVTYYIVDLKNYTRWTWPGIVFGANAIAVYVLADLLAIIFYTIRFGDQPLNAHFLALLASAGVAPKLASMLYAILFVCINFIPAYVLYRKKIFIKL
jgi:predicted acyltransferase